MNILITLPKHLIEKIISGEKEYEIRKCLPKNMKLGEDGFFVVEKGTDNVRSGDIIEIENEAGDVCKYNGLKQYEFFSAGRQFTGQIAKRYLKGYIEAVEKYGTE